MLSEIISGHLPSRNPRNESCLKMCIIVPCALDSLDHCVFKMLALGPNPKTGLLELCFLGLVPVQDFGSLLMVSIFGPAGCNSALAHVVTCPNECFVA